MHRSSLSFCFHFPLVSFLPCQDTLFGSTPRIPSLSCPSPSPWFFVHFSPTSSLPAVQEPRGRRPSRRKPRNKKGGIPFAPFPPFGSDISRFHTPLSSSCGLDSTDEFHPIPFPIDLDVFARACFGLLFRLGHGHDRHHACCSRTHEDLGTRRRLEEREGATCDASAKRSGP